MLSFLRFVSDSQSKITQKQHIPNMFATNVYTFLRYSEVNGIINVGFLLKKKKNKLCVQNNY